MTIRGYDVIGDVHGHCDALTRLLLRLGYQTHDGAYRHVDRRAVFVGDLIDRGPDQVGVVRLVRAMVEAGSAELVLGNHEFNAIAFATRDPDDPSEYLRSHNDHHRKQHREFLDEVGEGSALHREIIDWFMTIPMWSELSLGDASLRVVHACWHAPSMDALRGVLTADLALTASAVVGGSRKGSAIYNAIENVLKGPEVPMGGAAYLDKGGHVRHSARLQWWNTAGRSLRDLAEIPGDARREDGTPFAPLLASAIDTTGLIYEDSVPVLFGHYWRTGVPSVHSPTTASVDFSVAVGGQLVAYRWEGERELSNTQFEAVPWQP